MNTIGERLRSARESHDLTQAALAKRVNDYFGLRLNQQTISHIENGGQENSKYYPQIAHALGVRLDWLLTGQGPRERPGPEASPARERLLLLMEKLPDYKVDAAMDMLSWLIQDANVRGKSETASEAPPPIEDTNHYG